MNVFSIGPLLENFPLYILTLAFVSWGHGDKVPQTGCLQTRHLYSQSSGDQESEVKVPAGLVPSEGREGDLLCASLLASGGCGQIFVFLSL